MKKITSFCVLIALAAITFVSCSKKGDYTCTCTITVGGQSTTSAPIPYTNVKKSDAEKNCQDAEDAANASVPGSTTCDFK